MVSAWHQNVNKEDTNCLNLICPLAKSSISIHFTYFVFIWMSFSGIFKCVSSTETTIFSLNAVPRYLEGKC